MTKHPMTTQDEYDFYADPANQEPQGPAHRRRANLSELVPVRFDKDTIDKVKELAAADDRSSRAGSDVPSNTSSTTPTAAAPDDAGELRTS